MYQSIMVAVDDSAPSLRAALAAAELAKHSGGRVVVFHAHEHQDVIGKSGGTFDVEYPEEATAIVDQALAAVRAQGVPVSSTIVHVALGHVAGRSWPLPPGRAATPSSSAPTAAPVWPPPCSAAPPTRYSTSPTARCW